MSSVKFLVIGSMKSGTTSLSDYLSPNDEIAMCHPKEPQFFSRYYNKGIAYYESLWHSENKIQGEASTCYSRWPFYKDVPEKISLYNPEMKLIYIMRHPVERAYSHYCHNVLTDDLPYTSFKDAITTSDEILETSRYMQQLDKFLAFFPKEQILLLDFDELKQSPLTILNKMEAFVGAKQSLTLNKGEKEQVSNKAGIASGRRDTRRFLSKIRHLPVINFLIDKLLNKESRAKIREKIQTTISNSSLVEKYAALKTKRLQPLQADERKAFLANVISDVDRLEKFWDKDLSKWKV